MRPTCYPIVIWATDHQLPERLAHQLPDLTHYTPGVLAGHQRPAGLVVMVQLPPTLAPASRVVPAELAAWLHQQLPGPGNGGLGSSAWQLTGPPFRLHSPAGQTVRLSAAESQLLHCLVAAGPHQVVSRERLHGALAPGANPGQPSGLNAGYRALNMRLSRLRQKARSTGAYLHLEAVAGEGYRLSSPVISHIATGN